MRRCGPVNRLIMLKKRGLYGPNMQNIGGGNCVKSTGSAHDVNGPLGVYITHNGEFVTHNGERVTHSGTGVK